MRSSNQAGTGKGPRQSDKATNQECANPGVRKHDHVYFRHGDRIKHGCVLACGQHGATIDASGETHRVTWDRVTGHRKRASLQFKVVDQGEDGAIVEDEKGRQYFLRAADEEGDTMTKSMRSGDMVALFLKSAPAGNQPPRAGLTLKEETDKNGTRVHRWEGNGADQSGQERQAKGPHDGFPHPEGAHVHFEAGAVRGHGKVIARGRDGATLEDHTGRRHQVHWHEIKGAVSDGEGLGAKDGKSKGEEGDHQEVASDDFSASDFAAQHDDAGVTRDKILAELSDTERQKIADTEKRIREIKDDTLSRHFQDGAWSEERAAKHMDCIEKLFTPEVLERATPKDGQKPKLTLLGGRGGSGKGGLKGIAYDPNENFVLDPDAIKDSIDEYKGWNAAEVHEESSLLTKQALALAQEEGLNIVYDFTMTSVEKTKALVKRFKDAGYDVEAHYMHLPRQDAAKRAIGRYINGGDEGRYVPVDVVLGNTDNEKAFDAIKGDVNKWSFRSNMVKKGEAPKLIAQSGGMDKKQQNSKIETNSKESELRKSMPARNVRTVVFLSRRRMK